MGPVLDLRVGDRVQVRNRDSDAWLPGFVSAVGPLRVLPDGWQRDYPWKQVEALKAAARPEVGDYVEILNTRNTCTQCPQQIGNTYKVIVDDMSDLPFRLQGCDASLGEGDVRRQAPLSLFDPPRSKLDPA